MAPRSSTARLALSLLTLLVLAGGAAAAPATPRAGRAAKGSSLARARAYRVLLSDRASPAAQEAAVASLGRAAKARKGILEGIRRQQRGIGVDVARAIGEHGGPEALPSLLARVRTLSGREPRFDQYFAADAVAALRIADRHELRPAVERKVITSLVRLVEKSPSDGEVALNVLGGLFSARVEWTGDGPKPLNGKPVHKLIYSLLDHPDAEVRGSAARAMSNRGAPEMVVRALRGRGIRADRRLAVRQALLKYTVFTDASLKQDPRVYSEVTRMTRSRDPVVRQYARRIYTQVETERLDAEYDQTRSPQRRREISRRIGQLQRGE